MAGIGADIKEVIEELGTLVTVLRTPTNFTEKIIYEMDNSSSRSFFREYSFNAEFVYDSAIVSGDILIFSDGMKCIAAHNTPEYFENEPVEYVSILYKCNFPATALILTPNNTTDSVTFQVTQGWTVKAAAPNGLIYKTDSFTNLESETSAGRVVGVRPECFVPTSLGIAAMDRLYLTPTEYYRVSSVEKYIHPGIDIVKLADDERPGYTP